MKLVTCKVSMSAYSYLYNRQYSPQDIQGLTNTVISLLGVPDDPTIVSKQYSNERNMAAEVQAYAKISGRDWTFYVKSLETTIGRDTENSLNGGNGNDAQRNNGGDSQQLASGSGSGSHVDIDLGPAKVVSRKHAQIKFNMQRGGWELIVSGRNGAKVNYERVPTGPNYPPISLSSGTILDIGGTQMIFILPDQDPIISSIVLEHLVPKFIALLGPSGRSGNQLIDDIVRSSSYLRQQQHLQQIQQQAQMQLQPQPQLQPQLQRLQQPQKTPQTQPIRAFKLYNGTSSMQFAAGPQPIPQTINVSDGRQYLTNDPSMSNYVRQMSVNSLSASSSSATSPKFRNSITMGAFPHAIDFASDLSRDENRTVKPPHSYATMITQAILSSEEGIISLADIYKFISTNYAYYRFAKAGWQNSIRHNLSLNKAFEKVPRKPNEPGKGMKWRISMAFQKDFLEKWNSGNLSKIKRGSSVFRQLQLHMSKYHQLPGQKLLEQEAANGGQPLEGDNSITNKINDKERKGKESVTQIGGNSEDKDLNVNDNKNSVDDGGKKTHGKDVGNRRGSVGSNKRNSITSTRNSDQNNGNESVSPGQSLPAVIGLKSSVGAAAPSESQPGSGIPTGAGMDPSRLTSQEVPQWQPRQDPKYIRNSIGGPTQPILGPLRTNIRQYSAGSLPALNISPGSGSVSISSTTNHSPSLISPVSTAATSVSVANNTTVPLTSVPFNVSAGKPAFPGSSSTGSTIAKTPAAEGLQITNPMQVIHGVSRSHNPNSSSNSSNSSTNSGITLPTLMTSLSDAPLLVSDQALMSRPAMTAEIGVQNATPGLGNGITISTVYDTLLKSPSKPFHVTALEAYTPERGSSMSHMKSPGAESNDGGLLHTADRVGDSSTLGTRNTNIRYNQLTASNKSQSNLRSSPGVWNLLQFSSVSNTPKAVNEASGGPPGETLNMSNVGTRRTENISAEGKENSNEGVKPNNLSELGSSPLKRKKSVSEYDGELERANKRPLLDTENAKVSLINGIR